MKKLSIGLLVVLLLSSIVPRCINANPVSPLPVPWQKAPLEEENSAMPWPFYSVASGMVAIALTGSLIALRLIRKKAMRENLLEKNENGTPADAE